MIFFADTSINELEVVHQAPGYFYIRPAEALRPFIPYYTIIFPDSAYVPPSYGLFPDGTGTITLYFDGEIQCMLWGAAARIKYLSGAELQQASVIILIEFNPGGLFPLTGIDQQELTDRIFPLEEVDSLLFNSLSSLFEQAETVKDLIQAIDSLLIRRLNGKQPLWAVNASLRRIIQSQGTLGIETLASQEQYSVRHLNRLFVQYVGMSMKAFSRLIRLNNAVRKLEAMPSFTRTAQESGYYDQAHFIKDFRQICGITPSQYFENMSDFYNETLKY